MATKKMTKKPSPKKVSKKTPLESAARAKKAVTKKAVTKKAPTKKSAPAKTVLAKKASKKSASKSAALAKRGTEKPTASASSSTSLSSLVGKKAPAFTLQDQSGATISSSALKGKPYVLYFYPKDNTPGCTKEACGFRDDWGNFRKQGVTIFGVSPDSAKSHAGFASKYDLPFSLLADPEKTLAQAYGVWALKKNYGREYMGIVRSTFLVGKDGKVKKEWRNLRVAGHVEQVLAEAKSA